MEPTQSVRKVATRKQMKQQPRIKASTTPKNPTNWLKKEESRKRQRTSKKIPSEKFDHASKQAALQNKELFNTNRSFLNLDKSAMHQSENTGIFDIDSDINATQKIVASNDASLFKQTSPDSPPIGAHTVYPEHHPSIIQLQRLIKRS